MRGHVPAVAAYLVIAAVISIWGCFRGWRMALRLDAQGVMIRNPVRTYRIGWHEVRCFADGWVPRPGDRARRNRIRLAVFAAFIAVALAAGLVVNREWLWVAAWVAFGAIGSAADSLGFLRFYRAYRSLRVDCTVGLHPL